MTKTQKLLMGIWASVSLLAGVTIRRQDMAIKRQQSTIRTQRTALKAYSGKHKAISLKDGDTISAPGFKMDFYQDGRGLYRLDVYPRKDGQKVAGQQGQGATGIELINEEK